MRRIFRVLVVGMVVLVGAGLVGIVGVLKAQQSTPGKVSNPGMQSQPQPGIVAPEGAALPDAPFRGEMDEERRRALNDDRHKRLETDVDKLLALSTELKTDVDKTNKDELSLEVVKKAQEIEKLAHDVQSRMKN